MPAPPKTMTRSQYEALATFRYELRRFLRYSEQITRSQGLTPLQYQLMLQIRGFPGGRPPTVGELAERLQAKHHGVVSLLTRCERLSLIERRVSPADRRSVHVRLTTRGEKALERLARLHRDELLKRSVPFALPELKALAG
jgi:DNA-binding MarR family transcriptional regulator